MGRLRASPGSSMSHPSQESAGSDASAPVSLGQRELPKRPLPILDKPWFWALLILTLVSFPLVKSRLSGFPEPPPGHDSEPVELSFQGYDGRTVSIADLQGYLLVVSELPIGSKEQFEQAFDEWRVLKKRLKGLGFAIAYVQLVHGGDAEQLKLLLAEKKGEKVSNIYMLDPERQGIAQLRKLGSAPASEFFLLDSHGRMRGTYPTTAEGLTRLVFAAGVLANWRGSDPELGQPIREG